MDLFITQVPIWVNLLFILLFSTIPFYLILKAIRSTYQNSKIKEYQKIKKNILIFFSLYFTISALLGISGFFSVNTIPPRILLVTAWPLFIFYLFFLQKKKWFKSIMEKIKVEQLVLIHTFRFVGVFFFILYYYNALPKEFAYVGGYGDIITAIFAFPVAFMLKRKTKNAKTLAYAWGVFGLLDIFSVMGTAVILTKQAMEGNSGDVLEFGAFPFSWIPAFAPATIVFLHILIFKKLREYNIA